MHHQTQYILCLFYSARLQYRNDDANFRANSAENSIGISTFVPYMLLQCFCVFMEISNDKLGSIQS